MTELNRIKAVLAEKGIMGKWLAKMAHIANLLNVYIHDLICHTKTTDL